MLPPSTTSVSNFISSTIDQIKSSLPKNARIDNAVQFEIILVSQQEKQGKASVGILNVGVGGGVTVSDYQTHKVVFSIKFPTELESAEDNLKTLKILYEKENLESAMKMEEIG